MNFEQSLTKLKALILQICVRVLLGSAEHCNISDESAIIFLHT